MYRDFLGSCLGFRLRMLAVRGEISLILEGKCVNLSLLFISIF